MDTELILNTKAYYIVHLIDFYVVTKFEIPKVEDLKLTTFTFDLMHEHLNNPKGYIHQYLKHCQKIAPMQNFIRNKWNIITKLHMIF